MSKDIYEESLDYHSEKPYGKLCIKPTKKMVDQHDLALAYSPGVAEPCKRIKQNPEDAFRYTAKGNLIAVISNGTAVLGLGNIGALASKPVMEGKAVLFKKFSNIDAFDIEIDEQDPKKLVDIIVSLEPTFGGINLEDIKAPECFYVEEELKKRLKIPVIHDDQHGTAIVTAAGLENALKLAKKDISNVKLVCNGAGAAAIACLKLLCAMGLKKENILVFDSKGLISEDRADQLDAYKKQFICSNSVENLEEAMCGADIFLGLSVKGVITSDMVGSMNISPIIFALANPEPEILPSDVKQVRNDAIIATGRSDFPNQVNNAICYPYLFRGALDVGATAINEEMKLACVHAIAKLARKTVGDDVFNAYGGTHYNFGPEYIIPKPFDKRLFVDLSIAVAKAAIDSKVATRPIYDFQKYREELEGTVYRSSNVMLPICKFIRETEEKAAVEKIAFAEGEETRVLQAAQQLVENKICHPVLIGRPDVIHNRIERLGLEFNFDEDITIVNIEKDERFDDYWYHYHDITGRSGVSPSIAKYVMRTNPTVVAAMMVRRGDVNGMICGTIHNYHDYFNIIKKIIPFAKGVNQCYSLCMLVKDNQPLFFADPYIIENPTVDNLVEMTSLAIGVMNRFDVEPRVALLSHSTFGMFDEPNSIKMREATKILKAKFQTMQIDGEMQVDAAFLPEVRERSIQSSPLKGPANLFIMPNIDAAHIAYMMAKSLDKRLTIGPIVMGLSDVAHIANHSISVRGLVNLTSYAVHDLKYRRKKATDDS